MAPPQWAYQVDYFDPPPDEELICSICRAIFCEPVQCPCNHVYCRVCIYKWLQSNRNCPICRKRATKYSVQDVVPLIKNMIMKLTLRCRNSEHGCEEKFTLETCETHMKDCKFEMVLCKNKPCKEKFFRKDVGDHELNGCPHRYVKCKKCTLKISTVPSKIAHNCIKELKDKILKKNASIKKKDEKINQLKSELKMLKEAEQASSDTSSLASISTTDIMISLADVPSISPSSSPDSDSFVSDDEDDSLEWRPAQNSTNGDSLENRAENQSGDFYDHDIADSIEYPRASSPVFEAGNSFSSAPGEISQSRRPAKRRHPPQLLSSDDENDGDSEDNPSLPSPKRCWRLNSNEGTEDVSENGVILNDSLSVAGPSFLPSAVCVDSNASTNSCSSSNERFNFRPRFKGKHSVGESSTTASISNSTAAPANGNTAFERTIALLEQYNLESDPEWLPEYATRASSDSEGSMVLSFVNGHVSSSDESSLSDIESSDDSYEDASNTTAGLLFRSYDSSDDDDEWTP